jgi:dolichol kinase
MGMGVAAGTLYHLFLNHQQAVYILGICLCLLYIAEQLRINYPEYSSTFLKISKYFLRAEEQLKESASIPFVMGILLTLLTFPKIIALVAIFTLALGDPLSAIIGIKFGKRKISGNKTIEGSIAFFLSTFLVIITVFFFLYEVTETNIIIMAFIVSLITTGFELIPIRLDDNLTIPLFTAITISITCGLMGIATTI